jgi:putative hemolysin
MDILLNEYLIYTLLVLITLIFSAFFSATETAIISSNRVIFEHLALKSDKNAIRSLYILDNIERSISMILICNNITNISASVFVTFIAAKAFMLKDYQIIAVSAVQAVIFLILCEFMPKLLSRIKSESFIMFFSMPIKVFLIGFWPAVSISIVVSDRIKRLLGIKEAKSDIIRSREEFQILFRIGEKEGAISREHHAYVSEVMNFRDKKAREVMTPTIDIISVEKSADIKELAELFSKTKFSRVPVHEERVDNIIGYVFFRDILKNRSARKITEIMTKASYVPVMKRISEIYADMLEYSIPVFFVVNEYGAVTGMVTHEDIAEEVVGEIHALDQARDRLIKTINKNRYIIDGGLDIEFFMRRFNLTIKKVDFETVGGFLMSIMGKIPKKGDRIIYQDWSFIIEGASERSIDKIIFQKNSRLKKS